ncbi:MAG: molybdopterin-dependent oxidoreductase [Candidatus Limnocylindria bacterium]
MASRAPAGEPSRPAAALSGVVAGAAALGVAELVAGLLPGTGSLVVAIGDLAIALQPPGAKQFVVNLFGTADKLVLNLFIVAVALAGSAVLGLLARRRMGFARAGFAVVGIGALAATLRDPLVEPLPAVVVAAVSIGAATLSLPRLMRLATPTPEVAEMPEWGRRRFIGTSLAVAGLALGGGWLGRSLLDTRRESRPQSGTIPEPVEAAPPPPEGASLSVTGLSPVVTPNTEFYRIDTALLVPRPSIETWRLAVTGMVDRPLELTYDELLAMPLYEQYVTIACVSNEVGGDLVGNALWTGARLKEVLERAGVQAGATQIVGRAVDGFTVGFPTAWAMAPEREPLVAVAMNHEPLPPAHGYPARLIVPGLYGYVSATKWLKEIELTTLEAFDAYWVPLGWAKEAPILTQSRIDTPLNGSGLPAGTVPVAGVAWAPDRGVGKVEVQVDEDGWREAELSTPIADATWVQFVYRWEAPPGDHLLRVRATDGLGDVQTEMRTPPPPDGARGHHTIRVSVS